jgi:tRNA threonylcarbamoyl adenosine modification protein (Sua5/YciO/YrdC/YwlC family)
MTKDDNGPFFTDKGNIYNMLLEINPINPQLRLIEQVVKLLKNGAIVCYPTDTGYGIGCDLFNQKAIKQLVQLKKRPKDKPFSFMCSDLTDISHYAHVSNTAYRLLKKNLPGPYTFVLPGTKLVPKIMATKQKTVGIRVPGHPISKLLIETLGNPIVNTSVQLEDEETRLAEPFEIEQYLGKRIELIVDGGPIYPDPSSVIDLTSDTPEILRVGKGDVNPFR